MGNRLELLTLWARFAILNLCPWCFIKVNNRTIWTFLAACFHVADIVGIKSSWNRKDNIVLIFFIFIKTFSQMESDCRESSLWLRALPRFKCTRTTNSPCVVRWPAVNGGILFTSFRKGKAQLTRLVLLLFRKAQQPHRSSVTVFLERGYVRLTNFPLNSFYVQII